MGDIADSIIDQMIDDPFCTQLDYFHSKRKSKNPMIYVDFEKVIRETDKAWLVLMKDKSEQWFPKKFCFISEGYKDILIPEWLLKKIEEDKKK